MQARAIKKNSKNLQNQAKFIAFYDITLYNNEYFKGTNVNKCIFINFNIYSRSVN